MKDIKILQIIPAPPGLFARFDNDSWWEYSKALCLALVEEGDIRFVDAVEMCRDGDSWLSSTASNFSGLFIREDRKHEVWFEEEKTP